MATPVEVKIQFLKIVLLYTKSPSLVQECEEIYNAKKRPDPPLFNKAAL